MLFLMVSGLCLLQDCSITLGFCWLGNFTVLGFPWHSTTPDDSFSSTIIHEVNININIQRLLTCSAYCQTDIVRGSERLHIESNKLKSLKTQIKLLLMRYTNLSLTKKSCTERKTTKSTRLPVNNLQSSALHFFLFGQSQSHLFPLLCLGHPDFLSLLFRHLNFITRLSETWAVLKEEEKKQQCINAKNL